ncbi:hypothetical protein Pla52o_04710 [Novipirellula galeiformis]|uniref:Uncharacterized protein n=1 Tax=Novipirellula galeiformis TaxID=2528004 RepID=A0A5C6CQM1_9BACT|nr:hypothetical protein Pla52o_04710 [Novipirellula galeiformis]
MEVDKRKATDMGWDVLWVAASSASICRLRRPTIMIFIGRFTTGRLYDPLGS